MGRTKEYAETLVASGLLGDGRNRDYGQKELFCCKKQCVHACAVVRGHQRRSDFDLHGA